MTRPVVGDLGRRVGKHVKVNPATLGHHHHPVQHRDGKEPWCAVCKLTATGETPMRRPFGTIRREVQR